MHLSVQQLYQQLIAPIASLLPQALARPVIFMLQGALFQVPFAANHCCCAADVIGRSRSLISAGAADVMVSLHERVALYKPL